MKGLSGADYSNLSPQCEVPPPYLNWGEILPYRAQNFWTGPTTCPKEEGFATFDTKTGKLEIRGINNILLKLGLILRTYV